MKAYLVRIGIDQAFGGWNAPVDPTTGEFVFIPIPDSADSFHDGCCRRYSEFVPALQAFRAAHALGPHADVKFKDELLAQPVHLDPDFEHLTYGDDGSRRGAGIAELEEDDLLAFYGGLKPTSKCGHRLIYALVGLYVVHEVVGVPNIPASRWNKNAHTRKTKHWPHDIVVRAKRGVSGRLERCIPIGEFRDKAYRVSDDILKEWGDLSVKDGFIQRSAVPPSFLEPERFYEWFKRQQIPLLERNN